MNPYTDNYDRQVFSIPRDQNSQNSNMQFYIRDRKTAISFKEKHVIIPFEIPEKVWIHICVSMSYGSDGLSYKLYINGRFHTKETVTGSVNEPGEPFRGIVLGNDVDAQYIDDPEEFLNGRITDFYLFNTVLSDEDAKNSYNNRIPLEKSILSWHEFSGTANENDVKTIDYPINQTVYVMNTINS